MQQKLLVVKYKEDGHQLVIVSSNITYAESLSHGTRIYLANGKSVDIDRDIAWVKKHLSDNYSISEAWAL